MMRATLFAAALLGATTAWAAPPTVTVWIPDAPVDAATTRISTIARGNDSAGPLPDIIAGIIVAGPAR